MNGKILTIGVGLLIGLVVGSSITWYLTSDFVNKAVIEAELKFNELLETEKSKYQNELGVLTELKESFENISFVEYAAVSVRLNH